MADPQPFPAVARRVVWDVIHEHRFVLLVACTYILACGVVLTWLQRPWPFSLVTEAFASVWFVGTALWLLLLYLRHPRLLRAALTPRCIGGAVLVFLLISPFQTTFQGMKASIGVVRGFQWDERLSRWDIALHGGVPWKWLEPLLASNTATHFVDFVYVSWFPIFVWLVVWMSWSARRELRARALLAFLILWIGCGTLGAWATPSAGPCYYGAVVGEPNPYDELLQKLDASGVQARPIQRWLWGVYQADEVNAFAGVSAMPSMHVAMAVFYGLVGWQLSRLFGGILIANAALTGIGSVLLGWHYAIDGYVGILCTFAAWWLAGRLSPSNAEPSS